MCGLRVTRDPDGSTYVDQAEYIEKKAKAFGCDGPGRFFKTPMAPGFKPGPRPEVADSSKVTLARELMGSLIYATLTWQECKYACSKLSSVVTNPTDKDIQAMKRVLRYLYGSMDTKIKFTPNKWVDLPGVNHDPLS